MGWWVNVAGEGLPVVEITGAWKSWRRANPTGFLTCGREYPCGSICKAVKVDGCFRASPSGPQSRQALLWLTTSCPIFPSFLFNRSLCFSNLLFWLRPPFLPRRWPPLGSRSLATTLLLMLARAILWFSPSMARTAISHRSSTVARSSNMLRKGRISLLVLDQPRFRLRSLVSLLNILQ